ncbi:MAG: alcohol dehydrogenase catalytic domain-containing protein [Anaerostipes sp.]|jgi:L-iditol 2-dehydrogenase
MKAAVLYGAEDLRYEDVETPACPENGILVKTIACGICGSDLRTYGGGSAKAQYPSISGHEIAGEIIESKNDNFYVGTKLSIAPVIACGKCWYCKNGIQNQCDNMRMIGTAEGIPGGFAEYVSFTDDMLENGCFTVIPEGVDSIDTVIAETASSVLNAQINTGIVMEDLVVVIGAGTIGCLHGEIAKIRGTKEVMIVEMNPEKAELAKKQGFENVYTMSSSDPELERIIMQKTNNRGADVVICACPVGQAQADAIKLTRKRGKVIFFGGISAKSATIIDTNAIHYKEITVYGASAYSPEVNKKALSLVLSGQLNAKKFITARYELKDLKKGYEDMCAGKMIKGVVVFES